MSGILTVSRAAFGVGILAAQGCIGHIGDGPPDNGETSVPGDPSAGVGPYAWERLTNARYDNTVRDLLHIDARLATEKFSGEGLGSSGFATPGLVTTLDVERFAVVAHELGEQALPGLVSGDLLPCDPLQVGEAACADAFISQFGRRCFRRPLDPEESAAFAALYASSRDELEYDFSNGLRVVIEAMLQSPAFLYLGEARDEAEAKDGRVPLGAFELASRLSYFLWDTMPDDELLDAAESGGIDTPDGLAAQANRLLGDAKADDAASAFMTQWLRIGAVASLTKADPAFTDAVKASAAEETRRFIHHVLFEDDGRLETLLAAPFSFVNAELAPFYGVEVTGEGFEQVDLPNRWGVLTQISVLASTASSTEENPIYRGKLIRENLLCHTLGAPPGNIPDLPPPSPDSTNRERHEQHMAVSPCKNCHVYMDPIGFGLGNYDATGRFRTEDVEGRPIDVTGTVAAIDEEDRPFDGPEELVRVLLESDQLIDCVTRKYFRYAFSRRERPEEKGSVEEVRDSFDASQHDLRALMRALVQSPSFRFRAPTQP